MELYNNNTDTVIGHNKDYSFRQRYINSGYVIGTVQAMRALFTRADEMVQRHKDNPVYSGSDQALFAIIYGQQEYEREVLRLKHVSKREKMLHPLQATLPTKSTMAGIKFDNIIKPDFSHESFTLVPGTKYQFGIGLDYFSEFGHQTMNSDIGRDSMWLTYKDFSAPSLTAQIQAKYPRDWLDCKLNLPTTLPDEIMNTEYPFSALADSTPLANTSWSDISLYTHLCLGTFPIMIHHNGDKGRRESLWPDLWFQPHAKVLLEQARVRIGTAANVQDHADFIKSPGIKAAGGAWSGKGTWMNWEDLCPSEYDEELFRGQAT